MTVPQSRIPRIFVSHAHADNEFCRRFVQDLRRELAVGDPDHIFYDEVSLHLGDDWIGRLSQEVSKRPIFIIIMTPNAIGREMINMELSIAIRLHYKPGSNHRVVPVKAVECDPDQISPVLGNLQYISIVDKGYADAMRDLVDALRHDVAASEPGLPTAYKKEAAAELRPVTSLHIEPRAESAPISPAPPVREDPRQLLLTLGYTYQRLGSTRVILPPLCNVPAGTFIMGSSADDEQLVREDEMPAHQEMMAAFQIARFPVTVAEYATFVRMDGELPAFSSSGAAWADQLQRADHPVTGVSYEQARAYAAWLARTTGQPWRLPTEAEWEKAARLVPVNGSARRYPWGDTFEKERCNCAASGRGGTSPVGAYPRGASPCGAQDMAGNVWEWTTSAARRYPYSAADGREQAPASEPRVLRGGSWASLSRDLRGAARGACAPGESSNSIGFRLALGVMS